MQTLFYFCPQVFMSLARLFFLLLVFGAPMASPLFETQPPAPIVFLSLARSFISDIGAHYIFDIGARNIIGIGVAFYC